MKHLPSNLPSLEWRGRGWVGRGSAIRRGTHPLPLPACREGSFSRAVLHPPPHAMIAGVAAPVARLFDIVRPCDHSARPARASAVGSSLTQSAYPILPTHCKYAPISAR